MSTYSSGLRRALIASVAGGLLSAALAAQSASVTFDPDQTVFELDPGETQLVMATVCMPGQPVKADIYLLADITTSMFPVLDTIKANAATIIDALLATSGADIAVGIGTYRDFPFDAEPFDHQVSPTKTAGDLVAAIDSWNAAGGGDVSEGQFYALYQLATDPSIGFRPGAKRIILWFGDAPAHDPICSVFNGFGTPTFPIDEALVTASLQAAGPSGGTAVIGIGTATSVLFAQALNDNPVAHAMDYQGFCDPTGTPGQADRIALATGGISTSANDPPQVVMAILDTVDSLLAKVDASCSVSGIIAPFVKSITPPYEDVELPGSENETLCLPFAILLKGPPCAKMGQYFSGSIEVTVNNMPVASQPLVLKQPSCHPLFGQLWIGPRRIEPPAKFPQGGPTDVLQILPTFSKHGTLESMPTFDIPDTPALAGLSVYCQCGLFNTKAFPHDPIKTSNGLIVTFGAPNSGVPFGIESGLHLTMQHQALLGGKLALKCVLSP